MALEEIRQVRPMVRRLRNVYMLTFYHFSCEQNHLCQLNIVWNCEPVNRRQALSGVGQRCQRPLETYTRYKVVRVF